MPSYYNPGISYDTDAYLRGMQGLAGGIAGFGKDIGESIQKHQQDMKELQEEKGFNSQLYQMAKQKGYVSQEDEKLFQTGNVKQQSGVAHGWAMRLADDMKQQQLGMEQQLKGAEIRNKNLEAQLTQKILSGYGQVSTDPSGRPIAIGGASGPTKLSTPTADMANLPLRSEPDPSDPNKKLTFYHDGKVWRPLKQNQEDALADLFKNTPPEQHPRNWHDFFFGKSETTKPAGVPSGTADASGKIQYPQSTIDAAKRVKANPNATPDAKRAADIILSGA